MDMNLPRRLDKFLADARLGSRARIGALIAAGEVRVNEQVTTDRRHLIAPWRDEVHAAGQPMRLRPPGVCALLHKPAGLLTAMSDPSPSRQILASILPEAWLTIAGPVGRLDRATTGALVMTDDGDLSQLLTNPNHHLPKRYLMTLRGVVASDDPRVEELRRGVELKDGPTRPARCGVEGGIDGPRGACTQVWIEITEGRNRQVRRMARKVGFKLDALHRSAIGPLALGDLEEGQWRSLTPAEVDALYSAAGGRDVPALRALAALERRAAEGLMTARELKILSAYLTRVAKPEP